jgi:phage baseplate assembly protein gpV
MAALRCTIEMDKTRGITICVVDADGNSTQKVSLLKDSITIEVAGATGKSLFTQTADSVSIKCQNFSVDADVVTCKSKQKSTFAASTEMNISGQQTVAIDGLSAKLSGTTVQISAQGTLNAEASGPATLKGSIANVSAPLVMLG